jgi:hypothetical protein
MGNRLKAVRGGRELVGGWSGAGGQRGIGEKSNLKVETSKFA